METKVKCSKCGSLSPPLAKRCSCGNDLDAKSRQIPASEAFETLSGLLNGVLEPGDLGTIARELDEQTNHLTEWECNFLRARVAIAEGHSGEGLTHLRSCMTGNPDNTERALRDLAEPVENVRPASAGLRYLELLHEIVSEKNQGKIRAEIAAYRTKHALGQAWTFFEQDGSFALECTDVSDIRDKLISGRIRRSMTCQKNHVGPNQPIVSALSPDDSKLEVLLRPVQHYAARWAGTLAVLGFVGSFLYSFYTVSVEFRIGWFPTTVFAICYLVLIAALAQGKIIVGVVAGFIGSAVTRGYISSAFGMLGFVLGNILSNALTALVAAAVGGVIGAVIGLARRPFLPRIT